MTELEFDLGPLDSFFFPDHRPFNQDDPGLGQAVTRFPPPPHVTAAVLRAALARQAGWRTGQSFGDIDGLIDRLGDGPFNAGKWRFGPPLLRIRHELYLPAPHALFGEKDVDGHLKRLVMARPGSKQIWSDWAAQTMLSTGDLAWQDAENMAGAWLPSWQIETLLAGGFAPAADWIKTADAIMAERSRVGLAKHYGDDRAIDGMLYTASHGEMKNDARFTVICRPLGDETLPDEIAGGILPFGSHGRGAEISIEENGESLETLLPQTLHVAEGKVHVWIMLLSPALAEGGIPAAIASLGQVVAAAHGRCEIASAWDARANPDRRFERVYPAGSCWFLKIDAQEEQVLDKLRQLVGPGVGIGEHCAVGYGAMLFGSWEPVRDEKL